MARGGSTLAVATSASDALLRRDFLLARRRPFLQRFRKMYTAAVYTPALPNRV
jgi:hypothetical protein